MSSSSKLLQHVSINIASSPSYPLITCKHSRFFSNKLTKGVDWAKRRKILRIMKYKQEQSYLRHTQLSVQSPKKSTSTSKNEQHGNTNGQDDTDIFMDPLLNPKKPKIRFNIRKAEELKSASAAAHAIDRHADGDDGNRNRHKHNNFEMDENDDADDEAASAALEATEYQFRPALLTQMIKSTRYPHKVLRLWLRDRNKCPIDHINTSAAIVHLAQLCLERVHPDQIYDKCTGWSVVRLLRDVLEFVEHYDMRHVANIMWSLGVITSNMNDGLHINRNEAPRKIHRDFRRCAAKLVLHFENDIELRRKCNVQNIVDMLWSMNCLGLRAHSFFYQFCVDLYCKLDVDIGVTPDALCYLAVLYATRMKLNEKVKIKKQSKNDDDGGDDVVQLIYNEKIPKQFWLKLLKEFSDDFVLIEAEPHHVANILWAFGRIGRKHLHTLDAMEQQKVMETFNKLLSFVQERLAQCDGQSISMLLWCISCSGYDALQTCRSHPIFDYDKEKSIGSRIVQLIESEDCFIIPVQTKQVNDNLYINRYGSKAYNISLYDCIIIFEAVTQMEYAVPDYILRLMLNRMKEQLKYGKISMRELITLLESVDRLQIGDDLFYAIAAKRLIKVARERPKREWDYSEFVGLLEVVSKYETLWKNLDVVHSVLSAIRFNYQGWGQMDKKPVQLLQERVLSLQEKLLQSQLVVAVEYEPSAAEQMENEKQEDDSDESSEEEEDAENREDESAQNLSEMLAKLNYEMDRRLAATS